jgi:hypothetical protein
MAAWSKRLRRRLVGCGHATPPLSTPTCFPVRSTRHLKWLVTRKGRHFYRLYGRRGFRPVAIEWSREGITVSGEADAQRSFIPHAQFEASRLGKAIRRGRLYVLWDV